MISESLFICLLAGHFTGAVLIQPEHAILNPKGWVLFRQGASVALLSYIFCGWWTRWEIPLILFVSHLLIGYITISRARKKRFIFAKPQAVYLFIIILLAVFFNPANYSPVYPDHYLQNQKRADSTETNSQPGFFSVPPSSVDHFQNVPVFWIEYFGKTYLVVLLLITGLVVSVKAGGILIGLAVEPFQKQIKREKNKESKQFFMSGKGLQNGGKLIGQLERAVIFVLFVAGMKTGIGFLIAAKSILRFGEIKNRQQRMEAEYIIIGTLMSFGLGIVIAYATLLMIDHIK